MTRIPSLPRMSLFAFSPASSRKAGLFSFAYRLSDRPFKMLLNATLSGDFSGSANLLSFQINRPTTAAGLPSLRHYYLLSFRRRSTLARSRHAAFELLLRTVRSANGSEWTWGASKVVRPFPAGSASDTVSRVVLDQASRLLGQPVVIEVRPGAGGIVGFAAVAKSEPDGYTLVTSSSSMATEAALHRRLGYNPLSDFIPVVLI